jgi:hypothetical protein
MKTTKYILWIVVLVIFASCAKKDLITFNEINRLQFIGDTLTYQSFVYKKASVTKDTVYLTIRTIGNISKTDRTINIEQIIEKNQDNTAIPGTHYIAFNDPEISKHLLIKANTVETKIPIILLRDASLDNASFRLRVRILKNEFFKIEDVIDLERLIIFSNMLSRPASWGNYWWDTIYEYFKAYGVVKHRFMIENNPGTIPIDDKFFSEYLKLEGKWDHPKLSYYQSAFKIALNKYNKEHPDNPLREAPKEGQIIGDLVAF